MVETTQPNIEQALERCDQERAVTVTEQRAFERLYSRLQGMQPSPQSVDQSPTATRTGPVLLDRNTRAENASLRSFREAYRETVMSVPHFESDYGCTLAESLTAEFGSELSGEVIEGNEWTPWLYDNLREACRRSCAERDAHTKRLARERESLTTISLRLDECESRVVAHASDASASVSSEELSRIDERLADIETECADISASRQSFLQHHLEVSHPGITGDELVEYLYQDMEASYPALTDIADCLQAVRAHRRACLR